MAYGAIYRKTLNFNCRVKARLAVLLGVTLVTAACATGPLWSPPPEGAADPRATAPEVTFVSDTFAFANLLGSRFWTLVHWTNWRVTFWVTRGHQEHVAHEIVSELRAGRLVQLLVTNWPKPELNHTVVAFESRDAGSTVDFVVWDPNDPDAPGIVTFDRHAGRFWATRVYDTEPGAIRVFRMYYSRLL